MAHCRYCGNQVPDQAVVCVTCGCNPWAGSKFCQNCGAPTPAPPIYGADFCTKCGVLLTKVPPPNAKSKLVAGLLGIFVGWAGVHRFYLGYTGIGVIQIIATLCSFGLAGLWGFIEGILILCDTGITTDAQGRPLKE
ncbi:MAG TPA: TM2 domain-containing protein [Planctomycetota bacterium]|nr:TM2 domain-containing protein [Planctomycetota bacterium]